MKKILLLLIASVISVASFSQTTIQGDSKCTSPYTGTDPIIIKRLNVKPGEWVELAVPTNIIFTSVNGSEITTQSFGFVQAAADSVATFVFNASTDDPVVSATIDNGWVLPNGFYDVCTKLFSDKNGFSIQCIKIEIIGKVAPAINSAIRNRKEKHK